MPSIAHFVLGGIIGLTFYSISSGKFSKTHIFVLFMNNVWGPDIIATFGFPISHSLLLWPLCAFFLTYPYHYFTKFSFKLQSWKKFQIIEFKQRKLSFLQTFFLVLAGGIMHLYLDFMINNVGYIILIPGIVNFKGVFFTLYDLNILFNYGLFPLNPIFSIFVGGLFILGFVFLFIRFLKNTSKREGYLILLFIIIFSVFFSLFGQTFTLSHPDLGALLYIMLFWGIPMILLVLSCKEIKVLEKDIPIKQKREKKRDQIKMISLILVFSGVLISCISLVCMRFNREIINYIISFDPEEIGRYINFECGMFLAFFLELCGITFTIILTVSSIGLLYRIEKIWHLTVIIGLLFIWTVAGLALACKLSEDSIKKEFY
ncbi:MAG: hypothetical protein ACFE8E_11440 [Candidatus Hodarchaeota archaeon]